MARRWTDHSVPSAIKVIIARFSPIFSSGRSGTRLAADAEGRYRRIVLATGAQRVCRVGLWRTSSCRLRRICSNGRPTSVIAQFDPIECTILPDVQG